MNININNIREDFPILKRKINDQQIIYFDSAATSLKPLPVIKAITDYYTHSCANIHRGVHALSQEASELFENARSKIARFINADEKEIIFVRNATEAINLVSFCLENCSGILNTIMEHHSNFISWKRHKNIRTAYINADGTLDMDDFRNKLKEDITLAAVTHISNGLGVINPVSDIIELVHKNNSMILIDASQSIPHREIDVKELDCDFLVFSGHKMLGPSGIGVLYGKEEHLDKMPPFLHGGDMISAVHHDHYEIADLPHKFEAGTPFIEGVIGLGAAADYLSDIGMENICQHEEKLLKSAFEEISKITDITVHGPSDLRMRSSAISFSLKGLEAHGLAKMLSNRYNIMLRSGFHCAQPLHEALEIDQSVRASFYIYNTQEEIDILVNALKSIVSFRK
ncbi:aminotransferase class V-fold PLP-dependent enzyme [Elusimicrobiota bacterium]